MNGATVCLFRMVFVDSSGARLHCCMIGVLPGMTVVVGAASPRGCCCQVVCAAMVAGCCGSYLYMEGFPASLSFKQFVAQQQDFGDALARCSNLGFLICDYFSLFFERATGWF